jgi:hypothetical protein
VLNALDVPCDMDAAYVTKFQTLQDFVIDQYSQNRHVVLIIDEAQNLSIEGLEELRMLTNINSNKDELLQLILMGQPELREMITPPRAAAVRAAGHGKLPHFRTWTSRARARYVRHRLQHAGGSGEEFTDGAVDRIYLGIGRHPAAGQQAGGFRHGLRRHIGQTRRRRGRRRRGAGRQHLSRDARFDPRRPPNEADIKFYWRQILRRLP